MSSRSSIWFGLPAEGSSQPTTQPNGIQPHQAAPAMPPTNRTATLNQYVKARYYQQVQRRYFLQSNQLLQYAKERQTTPNHLWLTFAVHCKKYKLDNTLGNLIDFLGVTPKTDPKAEKETDLYKNGNNTVYKAQTEDEHYMASKNVVYNRAKGNDLYITGNNDAYQSLAENAHYVPDNNVVYITTKNNDSYMTANNAVYNTANEIEHTAGNNHVYTSPTESEQYMTGIDTVYNTPTENVQYMTNSNQVYNTARNTIVTYSGFINSRGTLYNKAVMNTEYYNYGTIYEEDEVYESYEKPMSYFESIERVFPDSYTYEDFLIVKRAAEDDFERKCLEEEAKMARFYNN